MQFLHTFLKNSALNQANIYNCHHTQIQGVVITKNSKNSVETSQSIRNKPKL